MGGAHQKKDGSGRRLRSIEGAPFRAAADTARDAVTHCL